MGVGNTSYQVAIEYSGELNDLGGLLTGLKEVESACKSQIPQFHTTGFPMELANKGYDVGKHQIYAVATRAEAELFQRTIIERGLATVVHVDEIA